MVVKRSPTLIHLTRANTALQGRTSLAKRGLGRYNKAPPHNAAQERFEKARRPYL